MDRKLMVEVEDVYKKFANQGLNAGDLVVAYFLAKFIKFFEEAKKEHDA